MSASLRMTTSPAKPPLFERPDLVVDEDVLAHTLGLAINAENFSSLIAANFLMALTAHDRKLTREYFEEILVTTFNLQNRMVRIAELNTILDLIAEGKAMSADDIKVEVKRHMEQATNHQAKLCLTLKLFKEMRRPEDPVS